MKMRFLIPATLALAWLTCVPASRAIPNQDVRVDWSPWHSGVGGEFSVQPGADLAYLLNSYSPLTRNQDPANNPSFQTFCVQLTVEYQPGDTMLGFLNNARLPNGNALPQGVAWLYNQFALGTLANYDYANVVTPNFLSRNDSAAALQNTIWWLFGDTSDPGAGDIFRDQVLNYSAALSPAGNPLQWALAANDPHFIPVEVLVTKYDPTQGGWGDAQTQNGYRQNFLARVPDSTATFGLLGFALVGVLVCHRRVRRAEVA